MGPIQGKGVGKAETLPEALIFYCVESQGTSNDLKLAHFIRPVRPSCVPKVDCRRDVNDRFNVSL